MVAQGTRSGAVSTGTAEHAQRVLTAFQNLERRVGSGFSGGLALAVLLVLYAHAEGASVPTSLCCDAVDAPRSTSLRWVAALVTAGLIVQSGDTKDRRLTLLALSQRARFGIAEWLNAIS